MNLLLLNCYLFISLVLVNTNSLVLGRREESNDGNVELKGPAHSGRDSHAPPVRAVGPDSIRDSDTAGHSEEHVDVNQDQDTVSSSESPETKEQTNGQDEEAEAATNSSQPLNTEQEGAGAPPALESGNDQKSEGSKENSGGVHPEEQESTETDKGETLKSDQAKEEGEVQNSGESKENVDDKNSGDKDNKEEGQGNDSQPQNTKEENEPAAKEEVDHRDTTYLRVDEFNKYKEATEAKFKEMADNETKKFEDLEQRLANISEHVVGIQQTEAKLQEATANATQPATATEVTAQTNNLTFTEPSVNCPLDCKGCVNANERNLFCMNSKSECVAPKAFGNFTCEPGFSPCGLFEVSNNQQFNFKNTDIVNKTPQTVQLQGSNMNVCIKLLIVHDNLHCNKENIDLLTTESQKILTPGFTSTLLPNGIVFNNLVLNAPKGKYRVCLAQYTNDRRVNSTVLQTLTNILFKPSNVPPSVVFVQDAGAIVIE